MKFNTFACVTLFAFGCSSPTRVGSRPDPRGDASQLNRKETPSRLETVNYDWEKYGIRVAFYRLDRDSLWRMDVKDSWSIYDQFTKAERTWMVSESKCSTEECLQIIDRSLSLFHAEKPAAKLGELHLEMQVVRDLWADILAGLNGTLSTIDMQKAASGADMPDEVDEELQRVASTSATIGKIKALLGRHGMSARGVYPSMLTFKDSLTGRKWSDIGKLPDAGVLVPGIFAFDLGESRIRSASDTGAKGLTVSQSATR
ncbi:hypothetical protein [Pedosphaera parvula]|nr:hypothetical protein [Pedosphaera parvula]